MIRLHRKTLESFMDGIVSGSFGWDNPELVQASIPYFDDMGKCSGRIMFDYEKDEVTLIDGEAPRIPEEYYTQMVFPFMYEGYGK